MKRNGFKISIARSPKENKNARRELKKYDDQAKLVKLLVDLEILLESTVYGNCRKCFCINKPSLGNTTPCCDNIVQYVAPYKVQDYQKAIISPLFLHNLFFDKIEMVSPIVMNSKPLQLSIEEKTMDGNDFPIRACPKAKDICETIIVKNPKS